MSNRIDIIIVVDTDGALAAGSLENNVYLIDTNRYVGSWQEGQSTLNTVCQNGQMLAWSVAPVDPATSVSIQGFGGQVIASGVCAPGTSPTAAGTWSGLVETQGQYASFAYTVTLGMAGTSQSFDAFLKVA